MRITVIGHFCIDVVFPSDSISITQPDEQLGGIINPLATLAALSSEGDVIYPIFGVGAADYERVLEWVKKFPTIDPSGIYKFRGASNRVHYYPQSNGEPVAQCAKQISDPIPFSKIKPYLDCDGVLINMESGNDITLETLDRIRMETREKEIPIHFDFHTLTLGIDKDSKRFRRPMTDWRRWCFMTTSVQLNEEEAAGLSAERFDENTLINHMMPLMVRALLITRHQKGVTLIRQESKKLKRFDIKGEEVNEVVETKGAGDVFGAAYIYQYLKTKNPLQSATFANLIASKKIQLRGTDELNRLTEMIRQYKNGGNSKPKTASEMKENAV
jgi:hypothetical protein